MNNNLFQTINGEIFSFDTAVIDSKLAVPYAHGYIIVPDGRMIVVPMAQDCGEVFSNYLSKYLGVDVHMNGIDASAELAKHGHMTYMSNIPSKCENPEVENYLTAMEWEREFAEMSGPRAMTDIVEPLNYWKYQTFDGNALVSLYDEFIAIPVEQAKALSDLMHSNKTVHDKSVVDICYVVVDKKSVISELSMFNVTNIIMAEPQLTRKKVRKK